MTEEERKAKDAARKREAYARRKAAQAVSNSLLKQSHQEPANPASIPPGVLYQDSHKDELADMLAASEERGRRTKLIMSMYQRDASNMNKLLWHILETLTRTRLEMVDLIGGLRNGK